jgi:hypothetical protein
MKNHCKSGISLIAVLLFMLAATTAGIIVFRWIGLENFSSGARLKGSEAYQASQAGLEAVQGWLANKGADAGALIKVFEDQLGPKKPVLLVSNMGAGSSVDLLAGTSFRNNKRLQKFEVYLTGVNSEVRPYKLKFLSVGMARDGSKHSQAGIFDVDGLYKMSVSRPIETNVPNIPAFYGGISANTQGRFSSAIINGDLNVAGLTTQGDLIVTGNMTTQDNGEKHIGCKSAGDNTRVGDMYVFGYCNIRGFTICGDAYVGGQLTTTSNPQFLKNLYAEGGINSNGLRVFENVTLGGNLTTNGSQVTFDGNLAIDPQLGQTARISIEDGSKISVGGSIWSMSDLFIGNNNNDKYGFIAMGGAGKSLLIPSPLATNCGIQNDQNRNCQNNPNRWFQMTTGTNYAHFSSQATYGVPNLNNKLVYPNGGANPLESMAEQIKDCTKPNGEIYKCVPDPLEVPNETKEIWLKKGIKLDSLVNAGDTLNLPKACIRLVARPQDPNANYDSHWGFGDALPNGSTKQVYRSMGDGTGGTCNGNRQYNFLKAANDCYADLLIRDDKDILYQNGDVGKKFLPLVAKNPNEKSPCGHFDGNFIFSYTQNMGSTMKLPPTTNNSSVFIYFQEGATANMPLEATCSDLLSPCKRNYFIFSEKDIAGSSGNTTINGAIFLANGSKITGSLPDAVIEFNPDLYKDLTDAGIVRGTEDDDPGANIPQQFNDVYHVPSTSHLKVKLESQYANEENVGDSILAKPAVLVLPRVIYLTQDDVARIAGGLSQLQDYYRVLYLNGAEKPSTEAGHQCPPDVYINGALGDNHCTLTSSACNNSGSGDNLCANRFYVVVIPDDALPDASSSSGTEEDVSSSSSVSLICSGLASSGTEGTAINPPALTCSNTGIPPLNATVSWNPPINWENPEYGTFNNITATADCGTGPVTSNSCGNLAVASNTNLSCVVSGKVRANTAIPEINRALICSNGVTATNVTYSGINWNNPNPGVYGSIVVTADCADRTDLQANCDGTITAVGLTCTNNAPYVKPGESIPIGSQPTLICSDNTAASSVNWTRSWGANWQIPINEPAGTQYSISATATCGESPELVSNLPANCGTVTVAGITCTPVSPTVSKGSTVSAPTLACNNGANATGISYSGSTPPFTASQVVGTQYNLSGTANCGNATYLSGISFSCPAITVADLPLCQFQQSWCPETDWETGIKWGEYPGSGPARNGNCYFWDGPNYSGCNSCTMNQGDGGYYVYFNSASNNDSWNFYGAKAKPLTCQGPVYVPPSSSSAASSSSSAGGSTCEYNPDWCGGKTIAQVTTGSAANNFGTANGCIFIKSAGNSMNTSQQGTIYINGEATTGSAIHYNASAINNRAKKDGGYYIWFPGNQWYQTNVAETGTPDCSGGGGTSSSSSGNPGGGTIAITSSDTPIPVGTHSITCTGGGQLGCWTTDGQQRTFTLDGADCNAYGGKGWGACGGGTCKAGTIVTTFPMNCAGMW